MPPKATFSSIIKTCAKNKDIHPGNVVNHDDDGNPLALPKHWTPEEIKELHRQQELAQKKAIAAMGLVEDNLREEDIACMTHPNRQLGNVSAFQPPVTIKNGKNLLKTAEKGLQDQIDSVSFELSILPCYYWQFIYHILIVAGQKKLIQFLSSRPQEELKATGIIRNPWRRKKIVSIKL